MKKIIFLIPVFIFFSSKLQAQCREYIKAIAPSQIAPYTLDGNFFAPIVFEGETVTLKRTFLAGQKYKVMVMGMDMFDKKITITDQDGFILFKNYMAKRDKQPCTYTDYQGNSLPCIGSNVWEFTPEQSTTLNIKVEIAQIAKSKKKRLQGCLGIVVGFMPVEK